MQLGRALGSPRRCSMCSITRLFKSLLFFGAGAVLTTTGERDMERLGGLIHRMPQTAFFSWSAARRLGVAAAQRLRVGMADLPGDSAQPAVAGVGPEIHGAAVGALLALAAALAAACFVGAFGMVFLGRARTRAPSRRRNGPLFAAAMFFLAALCLLAGILPGFFSTRWRRSPQPGRRRHAACRRRDGYRSCRSPKAAAPIMGSWCSCSS